MASMVCNRTRGHQSFSPRKIHQAVIGPLTLNSGQLCAISEQKGVPDDFGLLLDPIAFERPARFEAVVVPAREGAAQDQVPSPAFLELPDMDHFVDEMPLQLQSRRAEIVAIAG